MLTKSKTVKKDLLKTEESIQFVKDVFSHQLSKALNLTKVSSPIMVMDGTGINDDLNGIERCVTFPVKQINDQKAVVVNSLAKWKRIRLQELDIPSGRGILTDMRAIRPDEDYSPIHSIYVDQWDWEKHINSEQRNLEYLKSEVEKIYSAFKTTEDAVVDKYPEIDPILPEEIKFIHAEELLQIYPELSPRQREHRIAEQHRAVFIIGIGGDLSNTEPHDGRAPDYDDWSSMNTAGFRGLNGDFIVWNPMLQAALEISSMGIRVDKTTLLRQLEIRDDLQRKELQFHQLLLAEKLPQSIGGGIGQSRVCMFMLRRQHIGEVQVSVWPEEARKEAEEKGIYLL